MHREMHFFVPMLQNFFGCRINRVIASKEFYLIKTIFDNILVSNLGCKTSAFLREKDKSKIAGNDQVNFLDEIKLRMKKSSIFSFFEENELENRFSNL